MAETLRRNEVVRLKEEMRMIRRTGRRVSGPVLYLRAAPSQPRQPGPETRPSRRIAFLLNRGIRTAVRRNRVKRRLREIYRTNKDWFPDNHDYLLHVTPGAADLPYRHLLRHTEALARRMRDGE